MCFMEGHGVDGHVGDESSPYRNAFVSVFESLSLSLSSLLSCLLLSCDVLSCLFPFIFPSLSLSPSDVARVVRVGVVSCGCACVKAAHSSWS